jgi:SAM-dependent methyltransferase
MIPMPESSYARSAELYDLIYGHKPYEAEAGEVHRRIRQHLRTGGNALLDVGCGTGNHLAHLRHHYRCDGLDLDAGLLAIARRRYPDSACHQGDMADFDLGRRYDALASLFSAIGYVKTVERLNQAMRTFARHLLPGGVAVIEPWFTPDVFVTGTVRVDTVDQPELKIARMIHTFVRDGVSVLTFSHLVGRAEGIEHIEEHHELGLFTREQMMDAFRGAGLDVVEHDPHGLTGRGLYVARKPE